MKLLFLSTPYFCSKNTPVRGARRIMVMTGVTSKSDQIAALMAMLLTILFWNINPAFAYSPPAGIPSPGLWGTTDPINSSAPDPATKCPGWPSAETPGCYYVDNNHPSSTDTNNIYGYPDKPRKQHPSTYAAGAYVEIHSGTYEGTQQTIVANGTAENPVWIRGANPVNKPIIRRQTIINGSYLIMENLKYDTNLTPPSLRYKTTYVDHVCIRNSEFIGNGTASGNANVIWWQGQAEHIATDIIIYNNIIANFGDRFSSTENDYHGLMPSSYTKNSWILKNTIYHQGGDSIQVGSVGYTEATRPKYVYIGDNIMYEDRENAVDVKSADHVVVSNNVCYGFADSSSSDGEAIVIHDNPDNVWIINNKVYSSLIGIISTASTETYFIGNVVYDCPTAMHIRGATTGGIINNTLANYNVGISILVSGLKIMNNIFTNNRVDEAADIAFDSTTYAQSATIDNLLFVGSDAAKIKIGAQVITLDSFKETYNKCTAFCQESTAGNFIDPSLNDYHLLNNSTAINNGSSDSTYLTYQQRFGASIGTDMDGTLRPTENIYDIGADENGSNALPPPSYKKISGS
jgi:hypothetical protein